MPNMRPGNHSHPKKHKNESFTARAVNRHKTSRSEYVSKKQQFVTFACCKVVNNIIEMEIEKYQKLNWFSQM